MIGRSSIRRSLITRLWMLAPLAGNQSQQNLHPNKTIVTDNTLQLMSAGLNCDLFFYRLRARSQQRPPPPYLFTPAWTSATAQYFSCNPSIPILALGIVHPLPLTTLRCVDSVEARRRNPPEQRSTGTAFPPWNPRFPDYWEQCPPRLRPGKVKHHLLSSVRSLVRSFVPPFARLSMTRTSCQFARSSVRSSQASLACASYVR